jgi:DNA-binding transcriptional LysR family regulator
MNNFDWNHIRAFQATIEAGSLSAAARKLGLSQPTLSRQVASLEADLEVTLFERVGRRLELTDAGQALAAHAQAMQQASASFSLAATAQSETMEGTVVISASDAVAFYVLPAILERVREAAPEVTVEIVVSNALSDLRRREADIAIRHVRPQEPELVGRLAREATAGFFASREWVARWGKPQSAADAKGSAFIGSDSGGRFAYFLNELGIQTGPSSFPLRAESSLVAWQLARQGLGIVPIMHEIARDMPGMVEVLQEIPPIRFPVWLVTHREVHTSRRIRVVFDVLYEGLRG